GGTSPVGRESSNPEYPGAGPRRQRRHPPLPCCSMTGLSPDELPVKAGVDPAFVDRLVELGIIGPRPGADGPTFSVGALRTTRIVQSLQRSGLPLEGIGAAVASGQVSFGFLDLPVYDRFAGLSDTTFQALHEETGIPPSLL